MEPARVPQHLELEDVIAFGLGALDLVCLGGIALVGWWLAVVVSADLPVRAAVAAPFVASGLVLGVARVGDRSCRCWLILAAAYLARERVLVIGGGR